MVKRNAKAVAIDLLCDVVAGLAIAIGVYNFAAASDFPLVGFNGIALIFFHLFGWPIGITAFILNIPVAVICYRILGRKFFENSIVTIIITTVIMDFVAPMFPVYKGNIMLSAICTGVLSGVGYGLIYMRDSSTGGEDFITLSINARHPHFSIGKLGFVFGAIIITFGTVLVSKNIDGFIYGIIINFITSMVVDKLMYGFSSGKTAMIITTKPDQVAAHIDELTERGCTFLTGTGSYSKEDRTVVMCACTDKQMYSIRDSINDVDPCSFMVILESSEVFGKGFGKRKLEV